MSAAAWLAALGVFVLALRVAATLRDARPRPEGLSALERLAWPWLSRLSLALEPALGWHWRDRLRIWMSRGQWPASLPVAWLAARGLLAGAVGAAAGAALALWIDAPAGHEANAVVAAGRGHWGLGLVLGAGVAVAAAVWQIRGRIRRHQRAVARQLPFLLDVMTLCVEAGQSLANALYLAARYCPPGALTAALLQALSEQRAGRVQREALMALAQRLDVPGVHAWVSALAQADRLGAAAGPVLRGLSRQLRDEAYQQAEERAMQAPVKMLFPLMTCMFPCTFLVLAFPLAVDLFAGGSW